jgi:hypothetical protein
VTSPADRFLYSDGGGLGALWWAIVAFILGLAGILGLVKGAWWAGFLLVPACMLAVQASRLYNRAER